MHEDRAQVYFNDVRRTFINAALKAGISAHLVRKLINSVSSRDNLDFVEVDMEELKAAMEMISQRLLNLMDWNNEKFAVANHPGAIDNMA